MSCHSLFVSISIGNFRPSSLPSYFEKCPDYVVILGRNGCPRVLDLEFSISQVVRNMQKAAPHSEVVVERVVQRVKWEWGIFEKRVPKLALHYCTLWNCEPTYPRISKILLETKDVIFRPSGRGPRRRLAARVEVGGRKQASKLENEISCENAHAGMRRKSARDRALSPEGPQMA